MTPRCTTWLPKRKNFCNRRLNHLGVCRINSPKRGKGALPVRTGDDLRQAAKLALASYGLAGLVMPGDKLVYEIAGNL
jgi:hypothetical protein